jgi:1-acyl-sn-glycerol-3-phosphate acyltransferase
VCIFPEGRLTADGEIGEFRAGMMRILKETPVPVVPMALTGLWDSMFSRKYQQVWKRLPRRFWPKIGLRIGTPIAPEHADLQSLRQAVVELRCADR